MIASDGRHGNRKHHAAETVSGKECLNHAKTAETGLVSVLSIDRPDLCCVFLERIEMHHPVEDDGMKRSAVGIAFLLRGDGSLQTELGIRPQHFLPAAL